MFNRLGTNEKIIVIKEPTEWEPIKIGLANGLTKKTAARIIEVFDPDHFLYLRARAITANISNGNGDFFEDKQIEIAYPTFEGKGFYKDHDTSSIDKIKGKICAAKWINLANDKYVEDLVAVDRNKDIQLVEDIKNGIVNSVSMGCMVEEAICSVCNNVAHVMNELCEHMNPQSLKYCKGHKDSEGKTIYEINRGIIFNELSAVTIPADPTAKIFEILDNKQLTADMNDLNIKLEKIIEFLESLEK